MPRNNKTTACEKNTLEKYFLLDYTQHTYLLLFA